MADDALKVVTGLGRGPERPADVGPPHVGRPVDAGELSAQVRAEPKGEGAATPGRNAGAGRPSGARSGVRGRDRDSGGELKAVTGLGRGPEQVAGVAQRHAGRPVDAGDEPSARAGTDPSGASGSAPGRDAEGGGPFEGRSSGSGDRDREVDREAGGELKAVAGPEQTAGDEESGEARPFPAEDRGSEADVLLDVPTLRVDEINLEVADLRARVSLNAEVLDLLRLHVGADVALGRVNLDIKGVEAQALLKVRLDNVAAIIKDVLRTIDNNPELLENITRSAGRAVEGIGTATGRAVGDLGTSAGQAVRGLTAGGDPATGEPGGVASALGGVGKTVGAVGEGLVEKAPSTIGSVLGDTTATPSPPISEPTGQQRPAPPQAGPPERAAGPASVDPRRSVPEPSATGAPPGSLPRATGDRRPPEPDRSADTLRGQPPEVADAARRETAGDAQQTVSHDRPQATGDAQEQAPDDRRGTANPERAQAEPERAEGEPKQVENGPKQGEEGAEEKGPGQAEGEPERAEGGEPERADKSAGDLKDGPTPGPALGTALRDLGRAARRAGLRKLRGPRRR